MKNLFSTTAILAAMTTASAANAQGMTGDWYVSLFGGLSAASDAEYDATDNYPAYSEVIFKTELETGPVLGIAVGTEVSPNLRAEVELSYASYELGEYSIDYTGPSSGTYSYGDIDGDATATYVLANIWYDFSTVGAGSFTPYVGGGVGGVTVDVEGEDASSIAGQIGAGATLPVGGGIIDIGYRFKTTGTLEFDVDIDPITSSNLQVGYRISF